MRLSKQRRTWLEKQRRKELEALIAQAPDFSDPEREVIFDYDYDMNAGKEIEKWLETL